MHNPMVHVIEPGEPQWFDLTIIQNIISAQSR